MSLSTLKKDQFDGAAGLTRDGASDLYAVLKELATRLPGFNKEAADGAAATATAETPFFSAVGGHSLKFTAVKYVPAAALTADNAHYATLKVRKRTAAGGDGGVVAEVKTQITGSGDWTAFKAVDVPLATASGFTLAAGESLTVEITKTGNGVVVPAGQLQLVCS